MNNERKQTNPWVAIIITLFLLFFGYQGYQQYKIDKYNRARDLQLCVYQGRDDCEY